MECTSGKIQSRKWWQVGAPPSPRSRTGRFGIDDPATTVAAALLSILIVGAVPASAQLFPAEFELSDLPTGAGKDGFVLNGIDGTPPPNDVSGFSISTVGDMNGDGIDDFIVGAPGGVPGGRVFAGEAYVVFGRDTAQTGNFPAEFEFSDLLTGDGSAGFILNGVDPDDSAGQPVSAAGDVNDDGFDDLLIGATEGDPGGRENAGETFVVFGRDTAIEGNYPAEFELSSLMAANGGDGSAGFVINGVNAGDLSGVSVDTAGDVNGDGVDDIVVGAHAADSGARTDNGATYVVFGKNTANSGNFPAEFELSSLASGDASTGFVLNGVEDLDLSGYNVSAAGDVNHDGVDDLMIGAPNAGSRFTLAAGETYIVFGRVTSDVGNFPAQLELSSLAPGDGSTGMVMYGIDTNDQSGRVVNAAGDVNGDGIDDVIISALEADPGNVNRAGESYVVFGRDTATSGNFPSEFDLAGLATGDGSLGFVLYGIDQLDLSGRWVDSPGDVNGDGLSDLMIGATNGDPGGDFSAGETYVVYGRNTALIGNFPAEFALSSLATGDGSAGFVINGIDPEDISGRTVAGAGDVNGDGVDDMMIGAPWADPNSLYSGETYIVFGRADADGDGVHDAADNCTFVANADQRDTNADGFGNICDADLNGDCVVNATDLGLLRLVFFTDDADADLNGDGVVNVIDLGLMRVGFFNAPGPSGTTNECNAG